MSADRAHAGRLETAHSIVIGVQASGGVASTTCADHDVHLSTARFTECDLAVRDFAVRHPEFVADEVLGPCGMVRLWPR